jgi:predicted nuclease of predicted toxin-antitoxin system
MKLLLDQGLPRSAAVLLREEGNDAVHTGEIGLATATDDQILHRARNENRVVVTLDADFHALLALSGASSPSVIRIRIEGMRASALTTLLRDLVDDWNSELDAGVLLTVQPGRVRLRRLPLSGASE